MVSEYGAINVQWGKYIMSKLAIISGFLGGVKNRYMTYQEDRPLAEKFRMASNVEHLDGLELCYPADFDDPFMQEGWGRVEAQYGRLERAVSTADKGQIGRELGDLLFGMASLAREWGLNAEGLLREVNRKHIERILESKKTQVTKSNAKKLK